MPEIKYWKEWSMDVHALSFWHKFLLNEKFTTVHIISKGQKKP
jgi:hypothetical protein